MVLLKTKFIYGIALETEIITNYKTIRTSRIRCKSKNIFKIVKTKSSQKLFLLNYSKWKWIKKFVTNLGTYEPRESTFIHIVSILLQKTTTLPPRRCCCWCCCGCCCCCCRQRYYIVVTYFLGVVTDFAMSQKMICSCCMCYSSHKKFSFLTRTFQFIVVVVVDNILIH